jgi:cell division protein FtsN
MTDAQQRAHRQMMIDLYGYEKQTSAIAGQAAPFSRSQTASEKSPQKIATDGPTENGPTKPAPPPTSQPEPPPRTTPSVPLPKGRKPDSDPHTGDHTKPASKWGKR